LEGFDETVFDRECFWVCHVAADVVVASYSRQVTSLASSPEQYPWDQPLTFDIVVHPNGHLLDLVIGGRDSDLKACCESDGAERTVRCDCYVVRFCHCCDATELGNTAAVCDVYT
jgi:hypothetical protein